MLKPSEYPQFTTSGTLVPQTFGEDQKDHWSRLYREGDLEAGVNLACCYEMTGELADGLIVINEVLKHDLAPELRSKALLRKAVLQQDSPALAWKTISLADLEVSPSVRGKLHNQRGRILKQQKHYDAAIIEYTAAAYYFEVCESPELTGIAYNNLASIYRITKCFAEAHESVDRAIKLWRNYEYLPHALDQKALIHIDQSEYAAACRLSNESLAKVDGKHRWRAEFLTTLSHVQAGLHQFAAAIASIETALSICDYLGDEELRLKVFIASKSVCGAAYQWSVRSAASLALDLSDRKVKPAAKRLGVTRNALRKAIKTYSLEVSH